jgi:Sec-independent protein translocase protein TatA
VVKDWSLATIYKGMFEFMILQVIAIVLIIVFPGIATTFPEYLQKVAREMPVEQIKDDAGSLEQDPLMQMQEKSQSDESALEPADEKPADETPLDEKPADAKK